MKRWLLLVGLLGCGNTYPTSYYVMIDPAFPSYQQDIVVKATQLWVQAVNNPSQLSITTSIQGCSPQSDSDICVSYGQTQVSCPNTAGPVYGCTSSQYDGAALDNNAANVYLDTDAPPIPMLSGAISHIAQHELGHAFGLGHAGEGTVMFYATDFSKQVQTVGSQNVSCADVQQYVDLRHLTNYCQE